MDPYEQKLRDEVIYLHSLWHQGPPRRNPNSKPKHNPSIHLHPSNSTACKKNNTTKKNQIKRKPTNNENKNSESKWPCEKPVSATPPATSWWPALKPPPPARPASAEEKLKLIAAKLQRKGLQACRGFFSRNVNSDSDDEEKEEDEDFAEMDGCEECEEYELFLKLFIEDSELRNYYEKNYEGGDFYCLVCVGIGKKINKKFKNCIALVHHSTSISRIAKKRAHRAFGQVICEVLGRNFTRLPMIVLSVGGPLGRSLAKSGEQQGEQKENADGDKDNLSLQKEDSGVCQQNNLLDKSVGPPIVATGELIVCEESLKEDFVGIDTKITQEEIIVHDSLKEDDGTNQNKDSLDKEVAEAVQVRMEETEH